MREAGPERVVIDEGSPAGIFLTALDIFKVLNKDKTVKWSGKEIQEIAVPVVWVTIKREITYGRIVVLSDYRLVGMDYGIVKRDESGNRKVELSVSQDFLDVVLKSSLEAIKESDYIHKFLPEVATVLYNLYHEYL